MWPFTRKSKKTRETAIKRMNSFLSNSQNRNNNNISEIRLTNVDEENLNYVVNYIKDYAVQHLSVKREDVKVHVSKEGNSITIVANIIYNK
ncbi:MAG TPA: hypothetical protein PLK41_06595 [Defluviitoga tunisiensis]|jgi:hypothetical protein|uniref:Uncharacterized protein n=1 Tax=Defluviitoga tunisiensis TaxID=1006576 RepID=A0A0C7NIQ4_DEFTU|nr:hypothetical protein [Defluviitoga tunisiensis]MDD3600453.1 hypothetical protein [Defluviitoga tunisiensis]CEP77786.1 hypothetical protein DTL3_0463 [Defluviitoga tunisiensis]HHV01671.1 hypothetical protein [Defluviitoga tunisiensis]HOB55752.1 hypothetical protein [Defluviitoga tunisiensis]HOK16737.1 hypothetical protein [Defluviitoga tunisiensis]